MKVNAHKIVHPPGTSLHFFAAGARAPKIFSLKRRKSIANMATKTRPTMAKTC